MFGNYTINVVVEETNSLLSNQLLYGRRTRRVIMYNFIVILFLWNMFTTTVLVSAYINPKFLKEAASTTTTTNTNPSSSLQPLYPKIDPRNQQNQKQRVPFVWKTSISLPEIITTTTMSQNRLVWLSEPDYCIVSDTFEVPKNRIFATKDEGDDDRPKFCVKFYPQRLLETTEGSSSSSSSSTICLSLQYLGDTKEAHEHEHELPSYYYDTTFCLRWSHSSANKNSDITTSAAEQLFEWKGGKRFGGITTLSEKEEIFPDAAGIISTVTVPVEDLSPAFVDDINLNSGTKSDDDDDKKKMGLIVDLEVEITIHGSRLIKSSSSSSSALRTTTSSKGDNNSKSNGNGDDNEGGNGLVSSPKSSSASTTSTSSSSSSISNKDPKWWKFWQDYNKVEYKEEEESWLMTGFKAAQFQDVRTSKEDSAAGSTAAASKADRLRVGSIVIPLLSTQVEGTTFLPESIERPIRILVSTLFSATVLGGSWINVPTWIMKPHRSMWEKGVYPGIDYEITRISTSSSTSTSSNPSNINNEVSSSEEEELFYHQDNADYEVRPLYPLGSILDREWPVKINEAEIPNLISPLQYNIATAVGALSASASILSSFFVLSLVTSLFFIPTRSMEPTLNVGDVVLVEKITPRIPFLNNQYRRGDVVLFNPPTALQDLVEANGGKLNNRDLFVKRIAAVAGDIVEIEPNGDVTVFNNVGVFNKRETPLRNLCGAEPLGLIKRYIKPGTTVVPSGKVLLLGDCSSVSVDGRVWGTLNTKEIVGRPVVRTWPPSKAGSKIADLPTASMTTPIVSVDERNQWAE